MLVTSLYSNISFPLSLGHSIHTLKHPKHPCIQIDSNPHPNPRTPCSGATSIQRYRFLHHIKLIIIIYIFLICQLGAGQCHTGHIRSVVCKIDGDPDILRGFLDCLEPQDICRTLEQLKTTDVSSSIVSKSLYLWRKLQTNSNLYHG